MIDNIQKRIIYKKTASLLYSIIPDKKKTTKNFISTPHSAAIYSLFHKLNITPAFYNRNNLSAIFVNNKIDIIKPITKSGEYKLQCDDCDAFYIGQTGRQVL